MRAALAAAACALLLFAGAPVPAAAAPAPSPSPQCPDTDTSALCVQQRALDQVRAQLASNLAAAQAAQKTLSDSLADNARQQQAISDRISAAQSRLDTLEQQIREQGLQMASLEQQIQAEQQQIRVLARAVYFEPDSLLTVVARARSLEDLLLGTADVVAAGSRASEIERSIDEHRRQLAAAKAANETARSEQIGTRDRLTSDLDRLRTLRQQQADASHQLDAKIAQTRSEQAALDQQAAALAQAIADRLQQEQEQIIAEAMQRAWAQALLWIAANPGVPGISAGHSQKYRFIWPEPQAVISQGFGPTDLPLEPPYLGYPHFHTGIDLVEPLASPVFAADDGVVAVVGDGTTGYGRYVVLSHRDGLLTLYGHLQQALVKVGDVVVQGQPIGLEGSTGNSTGPHLHFELRVTGQPQDPTPLLPPGPPSPYHE